MNSVLQKRIVVCGTNGTGKTTFVKKLIESVLLSGANKKALSVLPDDGEPLFRPYTEIERHHLKMISTIKDRTLKVYFDESRKGKISMWDEIRVNFQNGILVLDDAKFYTGSNDDDLKKLFIRSRQNNIHIVFICHGLSEIPPNLFTFCTEMALFNTTDSWLRLKSKIPNPTKFEGFVNEVRRKANDHKPECRHYDNGGRCNNGCEAGYTKKIINLKNLY